MNNISDITEFFVNVVNNIKKGVYNLHSPLEKIVFNTNKDFAYIDNRKEAKNKYNFDFWLNVSNPSKANASLYSNSGKFPDFLFKAKKHNDIFICGNILELKDSAGSNISSFNSTIPTKQKSLVDVDKINNGDLVSRIAKIKDVSISANNNYLSYNRNCFYLIRTYKNNNEKVKMSIVDGSFFETISKKDLFNQMFENILDKHIDQKGIKIDIKIIKQVKTILSHITDQTIIASSQTIENASISPRLRIMSEVTTNGNPHSGSYNNITNKSFNLILQKNDGVKKLEKELLIKIPEIKILSMTHKNNGEYIVFQFQIE